MTAPSFWYKRFGMAALLLWPLSLLYRAGHILHQMLARPYRARIPVICVGNLVVGGSGKTPVALAIMDFVRNARLAEKPCFLSRGYGGTEKGPVLLNPDKHAAKDIGDEPFLLAEKAPVIIARDRAKAAGLAEEKEFDLLVMDDGLQNPGLVKNIRLVVINGVHGFGNCKLLPAGPLRETLDSGFKNADAFILLGEDQHGISKRLPPEKPVFQAMLEVPESWIANSAIPYIAFSGIAHPEKFYNTLHEKGLNIVSWHPYPDHHPFTAEDLASLASEADTAGARLITTAKDAVRLPHDFVAEHPLDILPVAIIWEDSEAVLSFLKDRLATGSQTA